MFDDPKEELRRLQQRLLEEEEWEAPGSDEDWLADAHALLGDDPDETDEDMDLTRVYGSFDWQEPEVRNFANGYGKVRNRDRADLDMEDYSEEVYRAPREKGVWGLVILACLELLGIGALAAYWLLVLL